MDEIRSSLMWNHSAMGIELTAWIDLQVIPDADVGSVDEDFADVRGFDARHVSGSLEKLIRRVERGAGSYK